jgi:hypothetical protein
MMKLYERIIIKENNIKKYKSTVKIIIDTLTQKTMTLNNNKFVNIWV